MSLDTPNFSRSLVDIVQKGNEYTISHAVSVQHVLDRFSFNTLQLEPGDKITVLNYDSQKGLLFMCRKSDQEIVISPNEAKKIEVEE